MEELSALKINHIAVLVKDLSKTKNFYTNILKLKEISRPTFFIKGIWYQLGESQLHLMLCENTPTPHIHPLNETVQPHFAISLTDKKFNSIIQKLRSAGIPFIGDIVANSHDIRQAFFYDPDHNMIEINNECSATNKFVRNL